MKILVTLSLLFACFGDCYGSQPQEERYIQAEEANLYCLVVGEGDPLIVIHGGPGLTQDYLLPQLYSLGKHNQVVFYDQRGCGKSTGEINAETINIQRYVEDLEAIRKSLNVDKISVLGHSWGGLLAMHYAITYPQSIDKLILANSTPASLEEMNIFLQEWVRRMAPFQEELAALENAPGFQIGDPDIIETMHRIFFRTYCYKPESADLLNLRMTPNAAVRGAKVYALLRESVFSKPYNLHPALKALQIPTLVIHGDTDIIPYELAENTHKSIEGSLFFLMKDCGHFPYVEDPEPFFTALQDFLKQ